MNLTNTLNTRLILNRSQLSAENIEEWMDGGFCAKWQTVSSEIEPGSLWNLIFDLNLFPEDSWESVGAKCRYIMVFK